LTRKTKGASRKACANLLTLYNYYTNLKRVNVTFSRLYLPNETNHLREKGNAQGLDKFSGGATTPASS
jgi:hypothetical protein